MLDQQDMASCEAVISLSMSEETTWGVDYYKGFRNPYVLKLQ